MLAAKTYVGLDSLPKHYSELFGTASRDSFFLTLPWFQTLQRTVYAADNAIQVIGVEDSSRQCLPRGALVLKTDRDSSRVVPQLTVDSFTNYYSSYFAPVVAPDDSALDEIVQMLVGEMLARNSNWDVLNIRPLDLSSPASRSFHDALIDVGVRTQPYFCFGNWYLDAGGRSYAEYFKGLSNLIRKNVPYYQRRLEKLGRVKTEIYRRPEDFEIAARDFELVYNSSWREPEAYPNFVRRLIQTAAEQGWLRMGVYYIDGEAAASQFWIVHEGIASIYKICYQEKFAKSSVGSVLTAQMMQYVLDVDKVREVDYLTGDDSYKANWMSDRRERWGIMAFNPKTLWGNLGSLRHIGGKRIKTLWDSFANDVKSSYRGSQPAPPQ